MPGDGWKASSKGFSVGSGMYRRRTLPSLVGNPFCNKKKDSVFRLVLFWIRGTRGRKDGRLIVSYQGAISAVTRPIATNKALQNRCKLLLSLCLKTTPQHLKKKIAGNCIFSIHNTLKTAGGLREIGKTKLWAISGLANRLFSLLSFCFGHLWFPFPSFVALFWTQSVVLSVDVLILKAAQGTMASLWVETVMCFYATPGTIAVIFCSGCKHPLRRFFFFSPFRRQEELCCDCRVQSQDCKRC